MGLKEDSVAARLLAMQAGELQAQTDALSGAFDDGVASMGTGGGFTQADIDAAVQAAQAIDAQALADAQAAAQAALDAVTAQLTDMTAKELNEEKVVTDLQTSVASVQAAFDAIKAVLFPVIPPVVPVDPVPVDPVPVDPVVPVVPVDPGA